MNEHEAIMILPAFSRYADEIKEELEKRIMKCDEKEITSIREQYNLMDTLVNDIKNKAGK